MTKIKRNSNKTRSRRNKIKSAKKRFVSRQNPELYSIQSKEEAEIQIQRFFMAITDSLEEYNVLWSQYCYYDLLDSLGIVYRSDELDIRVDKALHEVIFDASPRARARV